MNQNQEYDFSQDFVEGTELPEGKSVEGVIRSVGYVTRADGTLAVLINVSLIDVSCIIDFQFR